MNDIICPHCNTAFKVDGSGYADILKQVRDRDFEQQLKQRLDLAEKDKQNAIGVMPVATTQQPAAFSGTTVLVDNPEVKADQAILPAVTQNVPVRDEKGELKLSIN